MSIFDRILRKTQKKTKQKCTESPADNPAVLLGRLKRFSANYPLGSTTNFTFSVVNSSALVGVNFGKQASIQLPVTISPKRIIFSGIEYRDPTLRFCGTSMRGVAEDFHPMRGLILNAPVDYAMNNSVLHSAISVGVVCPDEHNQKFAQFISGLNRQSQAKHNTD